MLQNGILQMKVGIYDVVNSYIELKYTMEDGRKASVIFVSMNFAILVKIIFDLESQNSTEVQKNGWQIILNNFKKYV